MQIKWMIHAPSQYDALPSLQEVQCRNKRKALIYFYDQNIILYEYNLKRVSPVLFCFSYFIFYLATKVCL
jgi:predicted adenine nucleotide alpha hydrolase (AANH) superfamily ATPase